MDKKQRDAAIEREADYYYLHATQAHAAYNAGANSPANAEFIVRRAVEMTRKCYAIIEDAQGVFQHDEDEILAQILKELESK